MTTAHHHCPYSALAMSSSHFATKPPLGGTPISEIPRDPEREDRHRQRPPDAVQVGDAIVPRASAIKRAAMNMAALAKA